MLVIILLANFCLLYKVFPAVRLVIILLANFCISAIEDNYDGPMLDDGKVTAKFMVDLMEHYKVEKKLHKKYAYKVSTYCYIEHFDCMLENDCGLGMICNFCRFCAISK